MSDDDTPYMPRDYEAGVRREYDPETGECIRVAMNIPKGGWPKNAEQS